MIQVKVQKIKTIIQIGYLQSEQQLDLSYSYKYWPHVLLSKDWSNLISLNLWQCQIEDDKIQILLNYEWPQLVDLHLQRNKLSEKGIGMICSKKWAKLGTLNLSSNNIGNQGFKILQILFKKLNQLFVSNYFCYLYECGITSEGIKHLANFNSINMTLTTLSLSDNKLVGNLGIKWLIKSSLPNLEMLIISNCHIGAQGFKHLIKAEWPNLHELKLGIYPIQNADQIQLDGWQSLIYNNWDGLSKISVYEKQPICRLSSIFLSCKQPIIINKHYFQGDQSGQLCNMIARTLDSLCLFNK